MRYETAIPIGRGAVGEVYKAWDPRLERHVALKFLQRNDPELVARMSREAQAQARVEHPNIGKIYEVGEEDGRPFIAMQLIEGRTFDEVCPVLSLEQRVAILERVADAVSAAHRVGLVHRDLKPSNILVEMPETTADGQPNPFVVDFGIAREVDTEGFTQTGMAIGTPGYMAPEQARGERDIDRRIDVYALGVLLYVAVCGERPHPQDTLAEYLVAVLAQEPRPLRRLAPDVPVDLETVAMKCIESDPEQRYGSARMVAEELARFLEGEPVIARPIGTITRFVRRARRHRAATAALLTLFLAMAAGAVKYTLDLRRERGLAVTARSDAEELLEFMLGDLHESLTSIGRVDLLEQVARRSLDYYERNPPSGTAGAAHRRGLAYKNVARVLESQRDVDEALRAFDTFQEYFERLVDEGSDTPEDPTHRENRFQLAAGVLLGGELLHSQGRIDEAIARYRLSLETIEDLVESSTDAPRDWRRLRARTLTNLGWAQREEGDNEAARASYDEALDELTTLTGDTSPADDAESHYQLSATLSDMGYLAIASDRLDEARAPYERALEIALSLVETQPGNRRWDYELVLVRGRLGYLEDLLERPREALAQYELGAERAARLVSWDPANGEWLRELAFCRSSAGDMLFALGQPQAALQRFEQSLEISSRLKELNPESASAANDYAYELIQIGRIQETLGRSAAALDFRERALRALQPFVEEGKDSYSLETAAGVMLDLGRVEEAGELVDALRAESWHAPELYARADELGI